jgi:iron complex outermembrane receptor protein
LLAGARADLLFVDVIDPLYDAAVTRGLGYLLAKTNRGYAVAVDPNCNLSATFKPWNWLTTCFTYNYSQSIAQAKGGGFPTTIPASSYLHRASQLFELGAKATLLDGALFVSSAIFQQNRFISSLGGIAENDIVRGFEIEGDYQPSRNFYLTAGYSFLDAYVHGSPFVFQPYPIDAPQQRVPGGYVLSDNELTLPNGSYREPGLPRHLFNFLAKYQIPTNYGTVGVILGTNVTGPFFLGYGGYVVVPWQYNLDLTFFYRTKDNHFEARLALRNLTDQKNWSANLPLLGYDSVIAEWPFHVEATISIRF